MNIFENGTINILHCKFKLPRLAKWKGSNFYLELLRSYEKLINHIPLVIEDIYSTPLWFNKILKTNFESKLATKGYNIIM